MKFRYKLFLIIIFSLFIITCVSVPKIDFAGLGAANDKVPLTSRALTGTLSNGLRYFILENSMPENRAHVALVVNAGSVLETETQRGFAHFVEHLAFKGTERFPEMELIDYLRSLGMRFGPDANAYTSYDETVYHFDVPVENINGVKRIPDRALAILDDWTYTVSFNPEDVESEKRVVLEEIRTRSGAMDRVRKITMPAIFSGSAYADRQPIGLANIIENSRPEQLRAFYERWYTSDNMALVFVGDFDGKLLQKELEQHFNMPEALKPVNRPYLEIPPPKKGNFNVEIITDPELTATNYTLYFKQKRSAQRGTIAYYRETIVDYLINSMLSLRFEEKASDPQSAAIDSWGGTWRWSQNAYFYTMGTQPKTGFAEEALTELLLEKESMRRFGFTQNELDRAKINLVSYMEKLLSEKDRMESKSFIRSITSHFLFGEDIADIEWEVNAVNLLLPGIGIKEISRTVNNYFAYDDINLFLIAPEAEKSSLPSADRIRAVFRETRNVRLQVKKDNIITGELLDRVPVRGEIASEEKDEETGANIIILENGARIILQETANKNNEIVLYAAAKGGTANATEETIVSVNLLSEMVNVSGLGPYSRTELINKLSGKQVSMSFWNSSYYRGFQGSSTVQDINTLFEMIHLFFLMPKLDERAITAMIAQYRTTLAFQNEDPRRYFSRELNRIINNNHPLFMQLELKDIDKVSVNQAFDFLSQCINPGDYTFIFTGNLDYEQMRDLSAQYIGSVPKAKEMNQWINPGLVRPAEGRRTFFKGKDDRSIVYLAWITRGRNSFNEQRNQVSAVLSEYLNIMLTDEIREKLGGVYSISAGASNNTIPVDEFRLSVYFVCNPARTDELIKAVRELVTDLISKPINIDIFNKAKEAMLMQHERSIQQNLHIAQSYANSSVLYNTPLNRLNLRPNVIRSITPADVQVLCRQILVSGPVEVVLFPEGWE